MRSIDKASALRWSWSTPYLQMLHKVLYDHLGPLTKDVSAEEIQLPQDCRWTSSFSGSICDKHCKMFSEGMLSTERSAPQWYLTGHPKASLKDSDG